MFLDNQNGVNFLGILLLFQQMWQVDALLDNCLKSNGHKSGVVFSEFDFVRGCC